MTRILFLVLFFTETLVALAESTPMAQQIAAEQLGDKVQRFAMWTDTDGNVTGLIFINHQSLNESVGMKPGISDDDLLTLTQFPKLTALNLESQPVTERGLAVLRNFPAMKQLGFHYMGKARATFAAERNLPSISPNFITAIDGMTELEILEIKHNFRVSAIALDQLKSPFPKIQRLVLDTPVTAEQTLHIVRLCPAVKELQLHRTGVTSDQLVEIGRGLPDLEVFWFKPQDGKLLAEHLTAISTFRNLKIFSPQQFRNEVASDLGWESLASLPNLQRLEISNAAAKKNDKGISRLKKVRPRLTIDPRLTRTRNYDGL